MLILLLYISSYYSIVTYSHANENVPKNANVIMHHLFPKFEMFLKNQICKLSVQRIKGKKN